jgi:hypothetical protein
VECGALWLHEEEVPKGLREGGRMTLREVKKLHPGDEVTWNDPDDGACTRTGVIQSIKVTGNVVQITWQDGSDLECFARELS